MTLDDFRSTDLAGAAYYAAIYSQGSEPGDERPSRLEAEGDEAESSSELSRQFHEPPVRLPL